MSESTDFKKQGQASKKDMSSLEDHKIAQAEARLKYLLGQSDIFHHFGLRAPANNGKDAKDTAGSKHRVKQASNNVEDDEIMEGTQSTVLLKQPSILCGQLKKYQLDGLNWLIRLQENGINGILADEMGLGKTFQSISILAYTKEFRNISGPHLIVVPKSTLPNWIREFERWCPSFKVFSFHGSKDEREEMVKKRLLPNASQGQRDWDVCVTTYEMIKYERTSLVKIAWQYLIIDEAHRLKNEQSQLSQCVRQMQTHHRLLLTGTPLQNNLHELWSLLNFLLPDVFSSSDQFDDWFNLNIDDMEVKERIISQLHKLLRPFMLRRMKIDAEKSLPPKSETILFTGMTDMQKDLYRSILKRDVDAVMGTGSRTAILNVVMQLRKCCNHPYLFPGIEDPNVAPLADHLYLTSGKMILLDKLLQKLKVRGHRVLIFSQMTRMLDILDDYIRFRGYSYCRIDGNTSYEDREDQIQAFNADDSPIFIFLLSTRAGGLGINLQTADTVILYDSDWNPQADLQAQDRAHRIGQKNAVQVFRLVTDDTVEVKIVERAQQKLKLDAIVVQQGRLQEKDRKLSRDDLIETLRFGADKIFRATETMISDDDIDLILEQGRKRTKEMNEKLQIADKGDIYDFKMDGGMNTQVFEGKDYSERNTRENDYALPMAIFEDTSRRERASKNYSEATVRTQEETEKKSRLPKHLKLPRMEDWQFFQRERIQELFKKDTEGYQALLEKCESSKTPMPNPIPSFLTPEEEELKQKLLSEGFPGWNKINFQAFVRLSSRYGKEEYEKISKEIGKSVEETEKYARAFWDRGLECFGKEFERHKAYIEKGEKKLQEIVKLTAATTKLLSMYDDPWEQLVLRHAANTSLTGSKAATTNALASSLSTSTFHAFASSVNNAVENRFLLCLTQLHGHGNWEAIRNSIRRCDRFRFDFALQTCSTETIARRCEALMKAAEQELSDIENKKAALENAHQNQENNNNSNNKVGGSSEQLEEIEKKIAEETKRLAIARAQLSQARQGDTAMVLSGGANGSDSMTPGADGTSNTKAKKRPALFAAAGDDDNRKDSKKKDPSGAAGAASGAGANASGGPGSRSLKNAVPEGYLPELCKTLRASGSEGINKVVEKFLSNHPTIPKAQIIKKINEISVKEKRGSDTCMVWHIVDDYVKYLNMENFETPASEATTTQTPKKRKASSGEGEEEGKASVKKSKKEGSGKEGKEAKEGKEGKEGKEVKESKEGKDGNSAVKKEEKKKSSSEGKESESKKKDSSSSTSAKKASTPQQQPDDGDDKKEPKRYKKAFGFFVKAKRTEAEGVIGDPKDTGRLKDYLTSMWKSLSSEERQIYEDKEAEDKERYERELEMMRD